MHRRPLSALVLGLVTGLAFAGCMPVDDVEPLPAALEVGVAEAGGTGFIAIDEGGADVTLEPGAQGGFHVWVNLRVYGVSGEFYVEREARRVIDDQLVSRAIPQYLAVPSEAELDWWENLDAMPSFLCPAPLGIQVDDHELRFEVRLVTEDEVLLAEDSMVLTARCPDGDQADFCRDICSGAP